MAERRPGESFGERSRTKRSVEWPAATKDRELSKQKLDGTTQLTPAGWGLMSELAED